MRIGILLFSFFKMVRRQNSFVTEPSSYLLYSSSGKWIDKLRSILQKKVSFYNLKTEKAVISSADKSTNNVEIILDNEFISFKDCIHFLESARNKGYTFKILPKNANFLIGSNNSNGRGEIIKIV